MCEHARPRPTACRRHQPRAGETAPGAPLPRPSMDRRIGRHSLVQHVCATDATPDPTPRPKAQPDGPPHPNPAGCCHSRPRTSEQKTSVKITQQYCYYLSMVPGLHESPVFINSFQKSTHSYTLQQWRKMRARQRNNPGNTAMFQSSWGSINLVEVRRNERHRLILPAGLKQQLSSGTFDSSGRTGFEDQPTNAEVKNKQQPEESIARKPHPEVACITW